MATGKAARSGILAWNSVGALVSPYRMVGSEDRGRPGGAQVGEADGMAMRDGAGRMLGRVRPSLPLKACDLSREAETQGAWAQGCRENDLLRNDRALAFNGLLCGWKQQTRITVDY